MELNYCIGILLLYRIRKLFTHDKLNLVNDSTIHDNKSLGFFFVLGGGVLGAVVENHHGKFIHNNIKYIDDA